MLLSSTSSHLLRNVNKRASAILEEQQGWLILDVLETFPGATRSIVRCLLEA